MTIDTTLNGGSPFQVGITRIADKSGEQPQMLLRSKGGSKLIILPMPTAISSNTGIQWEQTDMGILGQLEQLGKKAPHAIKEWASAEVGSAISDLGKGGLGSEISFAVMTNMGGDRLRDFVSNRAQKMMHPMSEMTFRGVGFRSFQFQFELIPTNENNQDKIKEAIKELQVYSLPRIPEGGFLKYFTYPKTWRVSFFPSDYYLPSFLDSVITDISVDYSGGGRNAWHTTEVGPASVSIGLSITLTETHIFTAENAEGGFDG